MRQGIAQRASGNFKIKIRLQIQPQLRRGAELSAKPQCGIRRDAAKASKNVGHAGRCYLDGRSECPGRHAEWHQEIFGKNFSWMDRREQVGGTLVRDDVRHLFLLQVDLQLLQ